MNKVIGENIVCENLPNSPAIQRYLYFVVLNTTNYQIAELAAKLYYGMID
jgi:hypothetical protein